jgi:Bardet-Biedl syndrome 9 protein
MSIFQIKELWGTRVGANEEYDKNSVCLDSSSGEVKIIIGSFEGYLRVYKPK